MSEQTATNATRADYCAVAIAEAFRGDGERLCNPIGNLPLIGGRLARAAFEPDLAITDGLATLTANTPAVGRPDTDRVVEHWNPYRRMFELLWNGRRHVMMGASQVDRYGNQNLAAIGDWHRPKAQLLGFRGALATRSATPPATSSATIRRRHWWSRWTSSPAWVTTGRRNWVQRPPAFTRSAGWSPTCA